MDAKTIVKNMDKMKADRMLLDRKLEEISSFACPEKTGVFFNNERMEGEDRKHPAIITDCVSESNSILARGLYSNLCPPGVKFFQYSPGVPEEKKNQQVKRAFASASNVVFQLVASSNFASELSEAFEDFGWAGIVNISVEPDPVRVFKFRNYHISDYYVSENPDKMIDQVYREFKLTARQIVSEYSKVGDTVPQSVLEEGKSELLEKSEKKYTLIHAVYPNREVKFTKTGERLIGNENKRWRSITVIREKNEVIRDSGFDYNPYTVARFEKKAHSVYGYSPGLRILRSAKLLNRAVNSVVRGTQLAVEPVSVLDTSGYKNEMSPNFFTHPGAVNYYDSSSGGKPPQFMPHASDLNAGIMLIEKFEQTIRNAYFVNLFQLLQQLAENTKNDRTKFEVMQLVSEKHTLIIPIVARILEELLQPLFIKAFLIALDAGVLEDSELMAGAGVDVSFDSPLALAARRSKVSSVFDALAQVVQYSEFDGGRCLDYLNFDKITQSVLEAGSVDPEYIRSDEEVAKIRAAREAQMQQAQEAAQLSEMAKNQNLFKVPEQGSLAGSAMEQILQ